MRVLTDQELIESNQEDMALLAKIFSHRPIANLEGREDQKQEVWRWEETPIRSTRIQQMIDDGAIITHIIIAAHEGKISLEELMKYTMQENHSLCFVSERFGQSEVTDWNLEYLSPAPKNWNFGKKYWQTPLDYLLKKWKGKVIQWAEDGQPKKE